MSENLSAAIIAFLVAAIPGIFIALLADRLDANREEKERQQKTANGRMLLVLEIKGNYDALNRFWHDINVLDKENKPDLEQHLAAMAQNGFLAYALPEWSYVRWEEANPTWLAGLTAKEIAQIDQIYRDLKQIRTLYTRLVTISPQEQEMMSHGSSARFWYNTYANMRSGIFPLLDETVRRVLAQRDPLA
jgi:hypothetical protein